MCGRCRGKSREERQAIHAGQPGKFAPGADPRRHEFTTAERRRGFRTAIVRHERTPLGGWLRTKVRRTYARMRRLILAERRGRGQTPEGRPLAFGHNTAPELLALESLLTR